MLIRRLSTSKFHGLCAEKIVLKTANLEIRVSLWDILSHTVCCTTKTQSKNSKIVTKLL